MRSLVVEPMRYGRLFLAGRRGARRAADGREGPEPRRADVRVLARALDAFYQALATSRASTATPATALRRVWKGQRFSWWMTSMLHRADSDTPSTTASSSRSSTTSPRRARR